MPNIYDFKENATRAFANIKVGTLVPSVGYTGKKKQRHHEQTNKKVEVCRLRQVP